MAPSGTLSVDPVVAILAVGESLPPLEVEIDRLALIKYAGASDDYVRQHWDHPFMLAQGYPDVIAHGWLTFAHMCRAVTDRLPARTAVIRSYAVRYHRPLHPGRLVCGGEVTSAENGQMVIAVWARAADQTLLATGSVTLGPHTSP